MRPTGFPQRNEDRARERERERERVRNGVGIMCGETPRELETLEREIEAAHAPSVLASRFLDIPGVYKGQACTEFGHAERPDLWRRAPRNGL